MSARVERPIGIWVLTIFDGLVAALSFVVAIGSQYIYVPDFADPTYRLFSFPLRVILLLGIIVSSYLVWAGKRRSEIMLLAFIAGDVGMMIADRVATYVHYPFLFEEGAWQSEANAFWPFLLWLGVNCWYLLGKGARNFYRAKSVTVE